MFKFYLGLSASGNIYCERFRADESRFHIKRKFQGDSNQEFRVFEYHSKRALTDGVRQIKLEFFDELGFKGLYSVIKKDNEYFINKTIESKVTNGIRTR